jgi:branched-chain amino acid transport system ATP-binding protein
VSEIPTGKARLVELARSLVQEPKLLLLDEPASGQNDNETSEFADILRSLNNEGMSIFLVEHDMSLVMNVCDKIFVLDFGSLIAEGTTEEIQGNPVVIDAYLGGKSE